MKPSHIIYYMAISFSFIRNVSAQNFSDLDFEQSVVVSSNYNSEAGFYYGTANVPDWTGYLGANLETTILWNNLTLGNASIDVVGPVLGAIQGQFTLVLQPGGDPFGSGQSVVSASMSQTGFVPINAESLQFEARTYSSFTVSLGGQDLSLIPLETTANYTLYGAAISQFAGRVDTLTITALGGGPNAVNYFDSFVFSPSVIPEPSVFSLFALGGLFFCLRRAN